MTLAETLREKVRSWKPIGEGPHSLQVASPETGWSAQVTATQVESLGILAREIVVERTGAADGGQDLRGWAERIATRATGLLEQLALHEVDAGANVAILRSDKPTQRGSVVGYSEVVLEGQGRATLKRYEADKLAGTPREQVPFAVTHEALAKLAGDIAG
jgi:hypothetical protein